MANAKQKVNILVVGPEQSGKSTFIETLSMTPVLKADYRLDSTAASRVLPGTVEFGAFLTADVEVELRGLPCDAAAYQMFDQNWEAASEDADAVLVLVPSDNPQSFLAAHEMLDRIAQRMDVPFLVALTRGDEGLYWETADVADCFQLPEDFIIRLDPRNYQNAYESLNYLFEIAPLGVREPVAKAAAAIA